MSINSTYCTTQSLELCFYGPFRKLQLVLKTRDSANLTQIKKRIDCNLCAINSILWLHIYKCHKTIKGQLILKANCQAVNLFLLLCDVFLFIIWKKLKVPKMHFEIIWPLVFTIYFCRYEDKTEKHWVKVAEDQIISLVSIIA